MASLALGDLRASVPAHRKCDFNSQEMSVLQRRSNSEGRRKCGCGKLATWGWEVQGEKGWRKADSLFSLPKVSLVSGDDTASR